MIDPHQLLYWNRQAPLVCFAENMAGEVFVSGELPLAACDHEMLDRFLGLLLASAVRAREFVMRAGLTPVYSATDPEISVRVSPPTQIRPSERLMWTRPHRPRAVP